MMNQRKEKAKQQRQEAEEVPRISNWSELFPDLLRCVFKLLNVIDYNRAKSVCSSWHFASKDCLPKQNHIPWLILFPCDSNNNNNNSCVLFAPDDKDKVYQTKDLGLDFVKSRCLATYCGWLLMSNPRKDLYILNPLTGERIDLPNTKRDLLLLERASFWIDNKNKEYLVFFMNMHSNVFTKKGDNKWHEFPQSVWYEEIFYNPKNQKLYVYYRINHGIFKIWDFSGDKPREDGSIDCSWFNPFRFPWTNENILKFRAHIVVTVSGDVLIVAESYIAQQHTKTWRFHIFKANHVKSEWEEIDSLGDEALILDMGISVIAKDTPGIKRNSIYVSGFDHDRNDPDKILYSGGDPENIFVFDLTTQKMEHFPQCVFSSIQYSDARWFFPDFS